MTTLGITLGIAIGMLLPWNAARSQDANSPQQSASYSPFYTTAASVQQETLPLPHVDAEFQFAVPSEQVESATKILTQPWWAEPLPREVQNDAFLHGWELDQLIWLAVQHSPFVKSVLVEPQILQARAEAVNGQFDPSTFVETIFKDTSDPVGNTLTTGSSTRLNESLWNNSSGVRVKNRLGGQSELAQDFNFHDSNSDFFVPNNQADTKMVMRYTQPLARGAGLAYNRSSYVVASLVASQGLQQAASQIQDHVFAITNAYWELYAARAYARQTQRGIDSLQALREQLAGREDLDSLKSQLLRADAAIARQSANHAQAVAQIQAAQANLRATVAAPSLRQNRSTELVPTTPPADWDSAISLDNELTTALNYHPELLAIRESLKAARVRLQVAENELRPTLNLVLEGYVRGLNGDYNAAKSYGDQFSEGAPSYSAGLSYSRPYRNTAAKAILRERHLELRKTLLDLDHTLLTVGAEVEAAVAQVAATYSELESAISSTLATHSEVEYLSARWHNAFLDGAQKSLMLDQLLNANIQLIQAENAWARAQADHMIALANLRRTTGALLPMLDPASVTNVP